MGEGQKAGNGKTKSASEASPVVMWGGEKGGGAWSHAFDANDPPSSN